jgi:hypothetical protein
MKAATTSRTFGCNTAENNGMFKGTPLFSYWSPARVKLKANDEYDDDGRMKPKLVQ